MGNDEDRLSTKCYIYAGTMFAEKWNGPVEENIMKQPKKKEKEILLAQHPCCEHHVGCYFDSKEIDRPVYAKFAFYLEINTFFLISCLKRNNFQVPPDCNKIRFCHIWGSRDSAVSIATGYWMEHLRGRSSSPCRVKNFLFSTSCRLAPGFTQPPIQWVKRQGPEGDHSPPASAEVKKMWIYTSTPPYALMA
jgi:hypothetical protein